MERVGSSEVVAAYGSGTAGMETLKASLAEVWNAVKQNSEQRDAAASILQISSDQVGRLAQPPVELETGRSGFGATELAVVVVMWLGQDVLLGAVRDIATEELKKRVKRLWIEILEPALRRRLADRHGLGPPSEVE